MRRLRRYSLLAAVLLLMLVAVQAVACGDDGDDDEEPTGIPTATVTPAPTAKPSPTPAPADTAVASPTATPDGGLDLSRADYYLGSVAYMVPGFTGIEAECSGEADPLLESLGSEAAKVCYVGSTEFFAGEVNLYMTIASGETEKTNWRKRLQDEQSLEEVIQDQIQATFPIVVDEVTIAWNESNVGDMAKAGTCTVTLAGGFQYLYECESLVFYQEVGPDAAIVWILSELDPSSRFDADIETIAQEVSRRLGSR